MNINGRLHIDVTDFGDHYDDQLAMERAVLAAAYAPPGAEVLVHVRRGQHPPYTRLDWLRAEGQHLASITVVCDHPETITSWCKALRNEREAIL
ncbi:hypothetical protein N5P18_15640 [Janibacter terrae]|uniref:Uncharacterized protein n=1 Tax=Janibacter terrae TaxID=103817 RepID=A0ABZ2FEZ3_9MICO